VLDVVIGGVAGMIAGVFAAVEPGQVAERMVEQLRRRGRVEFEVDAVHLSFTTCGSVVLNCALTS